MSDLQYQPYDSAGNKYGELQPYTDPKPEPMTFGEEYGVHMAYQPRDAGRFVDESSLTFWQRLLRRLGFCPFDGGRISDYYGNGYSLKCYKCPRTYKQ